jgi:hypothetical protein
VNARPGLTAREIAEALADTPLDDDTSAPTRPHGAPNIGIDIPAPWADTYDRPAAWKAFGEDRKEQP